MFSNVNPLNNYEKAAEAQIKRAKQQMPVCTDCNGPIQDKYFYLINDEVICIDCLERDYRKAVEDFIA